MRLTFDEAIKKHRKLWDIVVKLLEDEVKYDNPEYYKIQALAIMKETDIPMLNCYCCEYNHQHGWGCGKCILKWRDFGCGNSEFGAMTKALEYSDYTEALRLAKIIRDLPERR